MFSVTQKLMPSLQAPVGKLQQRSGGVVRDPVVGFEQAQKQTNPYYGRSTSRQEPRMLRAALKISF